MKVLFYFYLLSFASQFIEGDIVPKSDTCTDYQCSVPVHLRQDCAEGETSRDRCLARGCCFDNSKFDTTWCFKPLRKPHGKCPHAECQVIPEDRMQCDVVRDVTPYRCMLAGCCYDDDTYGAPACFKRKVYAVAYPGMYMLFSRWLMNSCRRVNPDYRNPCGNKRCDEDQCLRWRCCWLPIALEGPQCYYPS
nr:integumentary mucin C.1-like isoform X2 [Ciona intestinalis]|eukprot:XP_002127862.1 integumentary mucin C.1-like isoform X2 [Ciona intestinalis]